jgi:hypothetical protein
MQEGDQFKLSTPTFGILSQGRDGITVTIPKDATITVVNIHGQMVDVEWQDQILMVFAQDLRERGGQIKSAHAGASTQSRSG